MDADHTSKQTIVGIELSRCVLIRVLGCCRTTHFKAGLHPTRVEIKFINIKPKL